MLDVWRGSRPGLSSLDEASKIYGKAAQWIAALHVLRDFDYVQQEEQAGRVVRIIAALGKGRQWQLALCLLREMSEAKVQATVISYSAGISACEKGEQWQRALALLSEMWDMKLEPD
ncbi:unnamed protein product, partial [Prorocentrum cordatum]